MKHFCPSLILVRFFFYREEKTNCFFERRLFFYGSNALGTENKNKFPLEHAFCFFTIKK
ncbi:hypothetical protein HMPREF2097_00457 [Enterococcus faecalis 918]|nr:hypothetical protein HMPREF2097_00457 [Enterococcus faecalis 918]